MIFTLFVADNEIITEKNIRKYVMCYIYACKKSTSLAHLAFEFMDYIS